MGTRHNGKDLERAAAFEEGLGRVGKVPRDSKARVEFVFGLIRRILKAAPFITRRDGRIAEEVLRGLNFTDAARALSPDNPLSMRSRISKRYRYFQRVCEIFLADPAAGEFLERPGRTKARKRTHSRTIIRGPNGHLDEECPKFVCLRGHTSPTSGRTHRVWVPPRLVLVERV